MLCIAVPTTEAEMFVNPMMLPIMIYQRWLDTVCMPFLKSVERHSANGVQSQVASIAKEAATTVVSFDATNKRPGGRAKSGITRQSSQGRRPAR